MAATSASRMLPRRTAWSAGSSGNGCNHGTSNDGSSGASGSVLGGPRPEGSGRRALPSSAVRQTFVAMRYSQVRTDALRSS
jgi:hypothetical protein